MVWTSNSCQHFNRYWYVRYMYQMMFQVLVTSIGKFRNPVVLKTIVIFSVSGQHHDHTTKQIGIHLFFFILINLFCSNTTCYLNRGEVLSENAVQRMVWKGHECVDLWNAQYVTKLNIVGIQASKKLVKLQKWVKSLPIEKCENLDHIYILIYIL